MEKGREWVEQTLGEMTLEERVGQLLMPETTGVLAQIGRAHV